MANASSAMGEGQFPMNSGCNPDRFVYRQHPSWKSSVSGQQRRENSDGRTYLDGYAYVQDEGLAHLLLAARIKDLIADISVMTIPINHFGHEFVRSADISGSWKRLHIHVPPIEWTHPWSIGQMGAALERVASERKMRGVRTVTTNPAYSGKYEVLVQRRWNRNRTVEEDLRPAFEIACSLVDEATSDLSRSAAERVLVRISFSTSNQRRLPAVLTVFRAVLARSRH
jgi:hypothetical protein